MTNKDLLDELLAMREVGITVTDNTLNHARLDDLTEYEHANVGEIASLFCELYNLTPGSKLWQQSMKSANE
jgi:hypothetical protein